MKTLAVIILFNISTDINFACAPRPPRRMGPSAAALSVVTPLRGSMTRGPLQCSNQNYALGRECVCVLLLVADLCA